MLAYNLYGFGADERYIPTPDQIVANPTQGFWYRIKTKESFYGTSKKAYGKADVKKGLYLMNDATWNDHIRKGTKGWESYKIKGLQATPHYSTANPHAGYGSGKAYPTVWIPPLSTGAEPEDIFGDDPTQIPGPIGPIGPRGEIGPVGPIGPRGKIGPIGPGGQPGQPGQRGKIGPPGEATDEAITRQITEYLKAHPGEFVGPPGQAGQPGQRGKIGPPGEATDEAITRQITAYLKAHPGEFVGPPGDPGIPGQPGEPGPPGERGEIGPIGPAGQASGGGGDKGLWLIPAAMALINAS